MNAQSCVTGGMGLFNPLGHAFSESISVNLATGRPLEAINHSVLRPIFKDARSVATSLSTGLDLREGRKVHLAAPQFGLSVKKTKALVRWPLKKGGVGKGLEPRQRSATSTTPTAASINKLRGVATIQPKIEPDSVVEGIVTTFIRCHIKLADWDLFESQQPQIIKWVKAVRAINSSPTASQVEKEHQTLAVFAEARTELKKTRQTVRKLALGQVSSSGELLLAPRLRKAASLHSYEKVIRTLLESNAPACRKGWYRSGKIQPQAKLNLGKYGPARKIRYPSTTNPEVVVDALEALEKLHKTYGSFQLKHVNLYDDTHAQYSHSNLVAGYYRKGDQSKEWFKHLILREKRQSSHLTITVNEDEALLKSTEATVGSPAIGYSAVATMYHEYGHHLHLGLSSFREKRELDALAMHALLEARKQREQTGTSLPSEYALTNHQEYFAESFCLFQLDKQKAKEVLPKELFHWIEGYPARNRAKIAKLQGRQEKYSLGKKGLVGAYRRHQAELLKAQEARNATWEPQTKLQRLYMNAIKAPLLALFLPILPRLADRQEEL